MHIQSRFETAILGILTALTLLSTFLPLLVVDSFLYPYVFPRTALFRAIVLLMFVCFALLVTYRRTWRPAATPITISLLALTAVFGLSSITGVDVGHSFWSTVERSEGLLLWIHLCIFFVIVTSVFRERREQIVLLRTVTIAGWLQVLYAAGQFVHAGFALITNGERLSGAVGNPAFLAAYLILIMGPCAWLATIDKNKWWRLSSVTLIVTSLFIVFQTQTRGAMVGIFIGGTWYLMRSIRHNSRRGNIFLGAFLAICAIGISALIAVPQTRTLLEEQTDITRFTTINPEDITVNNRLIVWRVGWRAFLEKPLLGWGPENFHIPFSRYFDPAIARDIGSNAWYDRAHNVLVEIGVASGLFGLLGYCIFIFFLFRGIARQKNHEKPFSRIALEATLIAYTVQNVFVFDTLASYLMLMLIAALINSTTTAQTKPSHQATAVKQPGIAARMLVVGLVASACACWIAFATIIRPAYANILVLDTVRTHRNDAAAGATAFTRALELAGPEQEEYRFILVQFTRDLIHKNGATAEIAPLFKFTVREIEDSIAHNPYTLQLQLLAAELYLDGRSYHPASLTRAAAHAERAVAESPNRYQPYTTLARIRAAQGHYAEAISLLTKATQLNDRFAEGFWNLAIANILSGQSAEALAALNQAEQRGYRVFTNENVKKLLGAYLDAQNIDNAITFLTLAVERLPEAGEYKLFLDELITARNEALQNQ